MALDHLLNLSNNNIKVGLSEERVQAMIPVAREYIAFWRSYPDLFVDFMSQKTTFKLYYYQRVFLRGVARHKYFYGVFPRAYSKSFLAILTTMIRCILQLPSIREAKPRICLLQLSQTHSIAFSIATLMQKCKARACLSTKILLSLRRTPLKDMLSLTMRLLFL